MSAVATTEAVPVTDASIHLVEGHSTTQQMHDTEQKRWMLWFGLPALVGCFFLGVTFATGTIWWLAAVLTALLVDIFVLVWLAMTSDTNGEIHDGEALSPAH
jgi:hypothetical protein